MLSKPVSNYTFILRNNTNNKRILTIQICINIWFVSNTSWYVVHHVMVLSVLLAVNNVLLNARGLNIC